MLDKVGSMLKLVDSLAKLTIRGYASREAGPPNPPSKQVTALYNPQSITLNYTSVLEDNKAVNNGTPNMTEYRRTEATVLTLSLICDSSLPGNSKSVNDQLADLTELCCQVDGVKKQPRFLQIKWGAMKWGGRDEFSGRVSSFDVAYNQFNRDGSPSRATVNLKLLSDGNTIVERSFEKIEMPSVPSVTLPAMGDIFLYAGLIEQFVTAGITGGYLGLAFFNDLDNLKDFIAGDVLLGAVDQFKDLGG